MKNIVILGVTGSIGTQAVDVIEKTPNLKLIGASCRSSIGELFKVIKRHDLKIVSVHSEVEKEELLKKLKNDGINDVEVLSRNEGLNALATLENADIILTSLVGLAGLEPTINAIKKGKDIALANKETLVGAGSLVMKLAKENNVKILPVDSEHSAIFQSLQGYENKDIKSIILTASGGPFLGKDREFLKNVKIEDALKHPNWSMGKKITIDSATLMNKGLEAIEAHFLFNVDKENIRVHVHPQSILHSAIEFNDNSVIGQMGIPDMRLPIQYALNYPERLDTVTERLDLFKVGRLDFLEPDIETFRCLKLAFIAMEKGGLYPLILNTADEIAVELFLNGKISFLDIEEIIEKAMEEFGERYKTLDLETILKLDEEIRRELKSKYYK